MLRGGSWNNNDPSRRNNNIGVSHTNRGLTPPGSCAGGAAVPEKMGFNWKPGHRFNGLPILVDRFQLHQECPDFLTPFVGGLLPAFDLP